MSSVNSLTPVSSPSMASADIGEKRGWLQDFLPSQLKAQRLESRVMSYGYDSGGILSKSISDIDGVAREVLNRLQGQRGSTAERKRPILFVAHSLGGVVVKQVYHIGPTSKCIAI